MWEESKALLQSDDRFLQQIRSPVGHADGRRSTFGILKENAKRVSPMCYNKHSLQPVLSRYDRDKQWSRPKAHWEQAAVATDGCPKKKMEGQLSLLRHPSRSSPQVRVRPPHHPSHCERRPQRSQHLQFLGPKEGQICRLEAPYSGCFALQRRHHFARLQNEFLKS